VTQRHKVRKSCWKNGVNRLAHHRAATNLQFVKNVRKQSTMKEVASAFSWLSEHPTGRAPRAAGTVPSPGPLLPCPFLLASECQGLWMAASSLSLKCSPSAGCTLSCLQPSPRPRTPDLQPQISSPQLLGLVTNL